MKHKNIERKIRQMARQAQRDRAACTTARKASATIADVFPGMRVFTSQTEAAADFAATHTTAETIRYLEWGRGCVEYDLADLGAIWGEQLPSATREFLDSIIQEDNDLIDLYRQKLIA